MRHLKLEIRMRADGLPGEYVAGVTLDADCIQAIVAKAAGRELPVWRHVRAELGLAIEQAVLGWAEKALPAAVQYQRDGGELSPASLRALHEKLKLS